MIGPFGLQGAAATLRQHCPQMTQRRCKIGVLVDLTHLVLPGRAAEPALVAHHALHAVRLQPQDGGRVRLPLRHFLDVDRRPRLEVEVRMQPHRRVEAALLPRAHDPRFPK